MADWQEATFPCGWKSGVVERAGLVNGSGLGVFLEAPADDVPIAPEWSEDWCDEIWCITHLNTGHAIARVEGKQPAALLLADALTGVGDWTFVGVNDWREAQPDLQDKVHAAVRAFAERGAFMTKKQSDDTVATAVYTARGQRFQNDRNDK